MYQQLAIQQTGATYIGKTKTGRGLYQLGGAVFKAKTLEQGRANFARFKFGMSKSRAKKYVGL